MFNKSLDETYVKQIVDETREDFKQRQQNRKNFESNWQLNINFYIGNQYSYISPNGEILDSEKQYFWQEREVYNHIAPIIEKRISKLNRVRPALTVVPFSDDKKDIESAKVSKKILKSVSQEQNISKVIASATVWSEMCGTSFYKVLWNQSKGRVVDIDENNIKFKEGDVEITAISPFEIFPDSNTCSDIDDCHSIIHARPYNVQEIKNKWGVDVEGETIDVFTLDNTDSLGGLGYFATSTTVKRKTKKDCALVIEKYEKPSIKYPNGRLIIIAGNNLIYLGELPYINKVNADRGFPFIRQRCLPVPNSFWGISVIDRCIPIQRSFNAVKNRKHEFLNRVTMGIMAVEDGSIDIENLEEEGLSPGKVLIYRQGATSPQMVNSGSVPIDFQYEENSLLNEFLNVSGVSDIESVNFSNMSGTALELMIEQDEIKMIATSEEIINATKDIAKMTLRLYKQFATLPHTSRIIGDDGGVEMFYWQGSDIESEDVVLETENEINQTLAQKRSFVFELLRSGLLYDENGKLSNSMRIKVLEQLGFGVWNVEQDMKSLQIDSASKENTHLVDSGKIDIPLEIDDHSIHINEHISFMLSKEFEKSKYKDIKELMLNHIRAHKEFLSVTEDIKNLPNLDNN
ncbi:MAG: hypothetical protein IJW28_03305 [Clostridia bacterium]|nr:hypothetical protein [Clostridia bacterium]